MEPVELTFDFVETGITSELVLRQMGYGGQAAPQEVVKGIETVLQQAPQLCRITCGYVRISSFNKEIDTIFVGSKKLHTGKTICSQLHEASCCALFVCSAGAQLSSKCTALLNRGDLLEGYIWDTVGSVTVEAAADLMQKALLHEVQSEGLSVTNRFSPGYCGWPVDDQHTLFSFFPEAFCGVTLTSSALMNPVKSVSGIIGIGAKAQQREYGCALCDRKDCFKRIT